MPLQVVHCASLFFDRVETTRAIFEFLRQASLRQVIAEYIQINVSDFNDVAAIKWQTSVFYRGNEVTHVRNSMGLIL